MPRPLWVWDPAAFTATQHFGLQIRDLNEDKIFMQKMPNLDIYSSFSSRFGHKYRQQQGEVDISAYTFPGPF